MIPQALTASADKRNQGNGFDMVSGGRQEVRKCRPYLAETTEASPTVRTLLPVELGSKSQRVSILQVIFVFLASHAPMPSCLTPTGSSGVIAGI